MKLLNHFPKLHTISESLESLSRNRDPNMTQNEHVYSICCRPEVAGNVISHEAVKTIECYTVLNFGVATTIALRENAFAFRLKMFLKKITLTIRWQVAP